MPLLLKMNGKPPIAISGVGTAPALATVAAYTNRQPEPRETGGRAVVVEMMLAPNGLLPPPCGSAGKGGPAR